MQLSEDVIILVKETMERDADLSRPKNIARLKELMRANVDLTAIAGHMGQSVDKVQDAID